MNWTEALTAYGFRPAAGGEMRKGTTRGGWVWTMRVVQVENGTFASSLVYEELAGVHVCLATAEGDTADRAFMALLNEKVGPGGVSVFAFIGAERSPAVAFSRHVEELKMAGKCAAQVRIPIEETTGSDGAMVSPFELLSIAAAKLRENQGDE
jgi:hypothetical protein